MLISTIDCHNKTTCRTQNYSCYLQGDGHRATLNQNHFRAITLLFMVAFRYSLVQLIVITRRDIARKITVATFKVKVTGQSNSFRAIT